MRKKPWTANSERSKSSPSGSGPPPADATLRRLRRGGIACAALLGIYLAFLVFAFPRDLLAVDPRGGAKQEWTSFEPLWTSDSAIANREIEARRGRMVIVSRSGRVWMPALIFAAATVACFWSAAWTARRQRVR